MYPLPRRLLSSLLICFLMVVTHCAPSPDTSASRVEWDALDLSPLHGRKIIIDPGHGGRFTGAVGSQGLRESDINLAVGLHLWGLLNQAGATVRLTRSADVDLCSLDEPNLGEDLDARWRLSNNFKADLFVSLHHNSDVNDRRKNNIQVYYKLTDSGASRDLAQSVAQELREGQAIPDVFVFPGNYRVLRNTEAVAILGEASFLSNRGNEKRLSLSNQLRREAEDYFLGIFNYFRKGLPVVTDHYPAGTTLENARPQIKARVTGGSGGESIDPKDTKLYLDDSVVSAAFRPDTGMITYVPEQPLENGSHTFYIEARNRNGNASWRKEVRFLVSLPPSSIQIVPAFPALPADGLSSSRLELVCSDEHGNPVIDGTPVFLNATSGRLDREMALTVDGCAISYFVSPKETEDVTIEARCQNSTAKTVIRCGPIEDALVRLTITDDRQRPLDGARVHRGAETLGISDKNGLVFLQSLTAGAKSITLKRQGFLPTKTQIVFEKGLFRQERFVLLPREGGLLLEKRITLDPEPSDDETEKESGVGADEERASFMLAKKLRGLLEKSGARVAVTRHDLHQRPTLGERVLAGEKLDGDYFITLTHRKGKPHVAHYFRSHAGKHLAQTLAQFLKKSLSLRRMAAHAAADFTIIHPRCPSIVVNFGNKRLRKMYAQEEKALEDVAQKVYEGFVTFLRERKEGTRGS